LNDPNKKSIRRKHFLSHPTTVIEMTVDLDIEGLNEFIRSTGTGINRPGAPIVAAVKGYEQDPRPLDAIPEVVALCRRVVESGLLSVFLVNVLPEHEVPGSLCALKIWAIARDWMKNGDVLIPENHFEDFVNDLKIANQTYDRVLAGGR